MLRVGDTEIAAKRHPVRRAAKEAGMDDLQLKAALKGGSELEQQMHDALKGLLAEPDLIPSYVHDLLDASKQDNLTGEVSWALAGLWALGRVEYVAPDFWSGTPAKWQPVVDVN